MRHLVHRLSLSWGYNLASKGGLVTVHACRATPQMQTGSPVNIMDAASNR